MTASKTPMLPSDPGIVQHAAEEQSVAAADHRLRANGWYAKPNRGPKLLRVQIAFSSRIAVHAREENAAVQIAGPGTWTGSAAPRIEAVGHAVVALGVRSLELVAQPEVQRELAASPSRRPG